MSKKTLYYVTTNSGKFASLKSRLDPLGIQILQSHISLVEPQSESLAEIASIKIANALRHTLSNTLVLDAAFCVQALQGWPNTSAKQSLVLGCEKFLKLMEGEQDRSCYFEDCLAYQDMNMREPIFFKSKHHGTVAMHAGEEMPGQKSWSLLHRIFIPNTSRKPLSEMSPEEHKICSDAYHSTSYASQFIEWYKKNKM